MAAAEEASSATAAAPSSFNHAALMMDISAILEGRDLHSFCMKDMWGALEKRLDITPAELEERKPEILDLVQVEVQRIMSHENEPSSKNAKKRSGKKRKSVEEGDWRQLIARREEKVAKAAVKYGEKSGESAPPPQQAKISTPLNITISDNVMELSPKTFSSGTQGFHGLQKLTVTLDGKPRSIMCQVSCAILEDESA